MKNIYINIIFLFMFLIFNLIPLYAQQFNKTKNIMHKIENPQSVYSTDLDRDVYMDLTSSSSTDDKISWYKNVGSCTFGPQQTITTYADGATSIYAADLDNDGYMDVISSSILDNKIAWYKYEGAEGYGPQQIINPSSVGAASVCAADLDGDEDIDVVSASYGIFPSDSGKISWYQNNGTGLFAPQQVIHDEAYGASSIFTADFNSDGYMDVLYSTAFYIAWHVNNGNGSFGPLQEISGWDNASIYTTDLDGDSDFDVLATSDFSCLAWFENNGTGLFSSIQRISDVGYSSVYSTDLDGDGDMDILCSKYSIRWYENKGSGIFEFKEAPFNWAENVTDVWAADLDNDGDKDVISVSESDHRITCYENDGSGIFGFVQVIAQSSNATEGISLIHATDLDTDGDIDIFSASFYDDKIAWYENLLYNTEVDIIDQKSYMFVLHQNYPNPFNPSTQIEYYVKEPCNVNLSVYNLTGQVIQEIVNSYQKPGKYSINLNMHEMPSGIYFYKIQMGNFQAVKKMLKIE